MRRCSSLRAAIAPYPDLANFFVEIQLQAALAGNGLSELPRARLRRVAQLLGLGPAQFARLESILRWSQTAAGARSTGGTAGQGGGAGASEERLAQAYSVLEAHPACPTIRSSRPTAGR